MILYKFFATVYCTLVFCIVHISNDLSKKLSLTTKKNTRQARYWIKDLGLFVSDRASLTNGRYISDAVINATMLILKNKFPHIGGLQNTILGETLSSYNAVQNMSFVQDLHVNGNHWITVSNIDCQPHLIEVYDSLNYGYLSDKNIKYR